MSTKAERELIQSLDSGELPSGLTPMGSCRAQEIGASTYSLIPAPVVQDHGLEQGTGLELRYHAESETLLVSMGSE